MSPAVRYRRGEVVVLALLLVVASASLGGRAALASRPGPPLVPARAAAVDLDRAGEEELLALPGVGPALARRLLDERDVRGPFASPDDVARRVRGVGPALLERWRGRVAWPQTSPRPNQ